LVQAGVSPPTSRRILSVGHEAMDPRHSASSSRVWATCCRSRSDRTALTSAIVVKVTESMASMIASPKANLNDSPNDPPAELTSAASLIRSSEMGKCWLFSRHAPFLLQAASRTAELFAGGGGKSVPNGSS
jgi:hypothetical protein